MKVRVMSFRLSDYSKAHDVLISQDGSPAIRIPVASYPIACAFAMSFKRLVERETCESCEILDSQEAI